MFLEDTLPELTGYAIGKMAQLGLMNALGLMGEADGIRVNAISPVAATRMFRNTPPPSDLRPDQVAPGVAFPVSTQCDVSGIILQASNGHFSTVKWYKNTGVDFGMETATPEDIANKWSIISGEQRRIGSVNAMFAIGGTQLGGFESGFVAALTTPQISVVSGGVICILAAIVIVAFVPSLLRVKVT